MYNNWWIENLPEDWKVIKFKHLFEFQKNVSREVEPTILSLTLRGLVIRDISDNSGQIAESYEDYALVKAGDFVMNPMDLVSGSIAIADVEGVVSNAYFVFRSRGNLAASEIDDTYMQYFFWTCYKKLIFFQFGKGLGRPEQGGGRWTLNRETLGDFPIPVPPISTQREIVSKLENLIPAADVEIDKLSRLLELARVRRNTLIAQTVLGSKADG